MALASGDYTVAVDVQGNNEVAEVGRALEHLGRELRKRMAVAQAGEAMLLQLVNGIAFPMAVFGPEGRVVAVDEAARTLFEGTTGADDNLLVFAQSAPYKQATADADTQGEPVRLAYRQNAASPLGARLGACPQAPNRAALLRLPGQVATAAPIRASPKPRILSPLPLVAVFEHAREHAHGFRLVEEAVPDVLLADAQRRLGIGLAIVFESLLPEGKTQIPVTFTVSASKVLVTLHATAAEPAVAIASALLKPLGGYAKVRHDRCVVALPRA